MQGSFSTHAPLAPGNDLICVKAWPGMNTAWANLSFDLDGRQGKRLLPSQEDAGSCVCASAVWGGGEIHTPSSTFPCRHWKMRIFLPRGGYNLTPSSLNGNSGVSSTPGTLSCCAKLDPDPTTMPNAYCGPISEQLGEKSDFWGMTPGPKSCE